MKFAGIDLSGINIENNQYQPLPVGKYEAYINNAYLQNNKAGDGKMLIVEYLVNKKIIKDTLWIVHPNPKAVEIGTRRMKELVVKLGIDKEVIKEDDFIGYTVLAHIKIQDGYNKVSYIVSKVKDKVDIQGEGISLEDDTLPF